jgi:cytochrome c oxidase assembly factor CtaG
MRAWGFVLLLLAGGGALAHSGAPGWRFDPWIAASLLPLLLLRPRAPWPFAGALLALFLALVWPLERLAEASFAAHMAQHMLLIGVAAPLLAASRPRLPLLKGRAALVRPVLWLAAPATAFFLHAAAIWIGHAPRVIEWSLEHRWVHALDHLAFVATAALLWWSLLARGRAGAGESALWTLGTMIHTGALGALLTFSPRLLYPRYGLEDQQLAGLVMWIPGGLCYLAAGLAFASAWLDGREQRAGLRG